MYMIDLFTEIIISVTKNSLNGVTYTVDDILKEGVIKESKAKIEENNKLKIVKLESTVGSCDWNKSLNNMLSCLPITDIDKRCREDERRIIEKYFPKVLDNPTFVQNQRQSYELEKKSEVKMLQFIATRGIGAHLLQRHIIIDPYDTYVEYSIDLLFLSEFKVRKHLIPYGAKLILNESFEVKKIITNCRMDNNKIVKKRLICSPTSLNFRFAYNLFMSSLLMHETVYNHALQCHYKISGNILAAYYRNRDKMPLNIKNFFLPFLYKTQEVNDRAYEILTNEGGLVNRIFGLSTSGLRKYYDFACDSFMYESPLEMSCVNTPLKKDLLHYWSLYSVFCNKLVEQIRNEIIDTVWLADFISYLRKFTKGLIIPKNDMFTNLKRIMTALMFNASVWHEYVGNISRYLIDPEITSCKIFKSKPNLVYDTEQNYIQAVFLASITSVQNMPKISDDLWKLQTNSVKDIWKELQATLKSTEFKNKLETKYLDPEILECSVSL
jgi:hypothetical protein